MSEVLLARLAELERRAASLENSLRWMRRSRNYWRALAGGSDCSSSTTWRRKPGRKKVAA